MNRGVDNRQVRLRRRQFVFIHGPSPGAGEQNVDDHVRPRLFCLWNCCKGGSNLAGSLNLELRH